MKIKKERKTGNYSLLNNNKNNDMGSKIPEVPGLKKKVPGEVPSCYKLTRIQQEVLTLLTRDFLTAEQIAFRRGCTKRNINKHLKKLKEMGCFDLANGTPRHSPEAGNFFKNYTTLIRLHGEEFNIKIIYQDRRYSQILKKSNLLSIDDNTIKLYSKSFEIYSKKSFFGKDANDATRKSLDYWERFFYRLEHELKIIIIKPGWRNIKMVKSHYAHTNSEIARKANNDKEPIKYYAEEDGKVCWITDDSFNLDEDETIHPETSKQDRELFDKHHDFLKLNHSQENVNDIRKNNPPTLSQLHLENQELKKTNLALAEEVNKLGQLMTAAIFLINKRFENDDKSKQT